MTLQTQQTLSMFGKVSETFESGFTNNPLVRSILNDYTQYCESIYGEEFRSKFSDSVPNSHGSLGCFFETATEQLSKFLKASSAGALGFSVAEYFSMYALLADTLWQRMLDVYAVFTITDGARPYKESFLDACDSDGLFRKVNARFLREENEAMYQMSRWAKFFRHPKGAGWLLHQPRFVFTNSDELNTILAEETRFTLRIIDDEFIRIYYPTDSNDDQIYESYQFERKKVVIVLPDFELVTKEICGSLVVFFEIVAPVYYEMLNKARARK